MTATGRRWRLRLAAAIVLLIVWVATGATAARLGAERLSGTPVVGKLFVVAVGLLFGLGGLWLFWVTADRIELDARGYHVHLGVDGCWYEERTATGGTQDLTFVFETPGDQSPRRSRVHVPSEGAWDREVPDWAKGRRAEIVHRIRNALPDIEIETKPG